MAFVDDAELLVENLRRTFVAQDDVSRRFILGADALEFGSGRQKLLRRYSRPGKITSGYTASLISNDISIGESQDTGLRMGETGQRGGIAQGGRGTGVQKEQSRANQEHDGKANDAKETETSTAAGARATAGQDANGKANGGGPDTAVKSKTGTGKSLGDDLFGRLRESQVRARLWYAKGADGDGEDDEENTTTQAIKGTPPAAANADEAKGEGKDPNPRSGLSRLFAPDPRDGPRENPFQTHLRFSGEGHVGARRTVKLNVLFTFQDVPEGISITQARDQRTMRLVLLTNAMVHNVLGVALSKYWDEEREPKPEENVDAYCLRMCDDDDGEPDMDFPPLDYKQPISKFGFPLLAICPNPKWKKPGAASGAGMAQATAGGPPPAMTAAQRRAVSSGNATSIIGGGIGSMISGANNTAAASAVNKANQARPRTNTASKAGKVFIRIYLPSHGSSILPVESKDITLKELLQMVLRKRALPYGQHSLELVDAPGAELDLRQTLSAIGVEEFKLIHKFSKRVDIQEEEPDDDAQRDVEYSLNIHQYKSYQVTREKFLGKEQYIMAIDGDKVQVSPVNRSSGLFGTKKAALVTYEMDRIVHCGLDSASSASAVAESDDINGADDPHAESGFPRAHSTGRKGGRESTSRAPVTANGGIGVGSGDGKASAGDFPAVPPSSSSHVDKKTTCVFHFIYWRDPKYKSYTFEASSPGVAAEIVKKVSLICSLRPSEYRAQYAIHELSQRQQIL
eukprot:Clim_evm57s128 gene=Clim_evmTU57s128